MARAETAAGKVEAETPEPSVLGNISPHHDELSSETPPSYNQLNYNDNLSRFFNSQPKTLSEKEVSAIEDQGDSAETSASNLQQQQHDQGDAIPMQDGAW